ncbi:aspartyl-phosphate phosphatase Spo0E family protein [Halobacillus locisalis]|uniref:Aspartyl-phosphate phosphatase Spo0E family protein n=1 Tax=Halobacillus locisalis TaxID=220753 RepID=A0A838CWQ9_9BACI|nr:aspartyl-phosphate phosphatase Spo0E family protein [Halobacillus locisalis]MBA2176353.1 aspartyl-phosphate phosphatase Spo0E family protein [Halobacillus locisalis]
MQQKNGLEEQIEVLRLKMYRMYEENPQDERLLEVSQELDQLLNQYAKQDPTN